jgi:acyl-CoA thioesterase-1
MCSRWWFLRRSCGDEAPKLRALPQDAVILAFGDSHTHGTVARPSESYPERLAARISRVGVNAGTPGEVTAAGLRRLPGVLEQSAPVLVLLCHGGNDILRKLSQGQAVENLCAMIRIRRASRHTGRTEVWFDT